MRRFEAGAVARADGLLVREGLPCAVGPRGLALLPGCDLGARLRRCCRSTGRGGGLLPSLVAEEVGEGVVRLALSAELTRVSSPCGVRLLRRPARVLVVGAAEESVDARVLDLRRVVPAGEPAGGALRLGCRRGRPAPRVRGVAAGFGLFVERLRVGQSAGRRRGVGRTVLGRFAHRVPAGRVAVPVGVACVRVLHVRILRCLRAVSGSLGAPVTVVRRIHRYLPLPLLAS